MASPPEPIDARMAALHEGGLAMLRYAVIATLLAVLIGLGNWLSSGGAKETMRNAG